MTGVLARLGNVLYWLCTGVAVLFVLGGVFLALDGPSLWRDKQPFFAAFPEISGEEPDVVDKLLRGYGATPESPKNLPDLREELLTMNSSADDENRLALAAILAVLAIVVWLMGRAARYILAGR